MELKSTKAGMLTALLLGAVVLCGALPVRMVGEEADAEQAIAEQWPEKEQELLQQDAEAPEEAEPAEMQDSIEDASSELDWLPPEYAQQEELDPQAEPEPEPEPEPELELEYEQADEPQVEVEQDDEYLLEEEQEAATQYDADTSPTRRDLREEHSRLVLAAEGLRSLIEEVAGFIMPAVSSANKNVAYKTPRGKTAEQNNGEDTDPEKELGTLEVRAEEEELETSLQQLAPPTGNWSIVNLFIAMVCFTAAILMLVGMLSQRKGPQAQPLWRSDKLGFGWGVAGVVSGLLALAAFLATTNMSATMVIANRWTFLMLVLLLVQITTVALLRLGSATGDTPGRYWSGTIE